MKTINQEQMNTQDKHEKKQSLYSCAKHGQEYALTAESRKGYTVKLFNPLTPLLV